MPCPAMAIAMAPASGGSPAAMAAGSRIADTSGTAGVGQKNSEITYVQRAMMMNDECPPRITRRNGCTMRTSACSVLSALSRAVMKVITRKILKSSLAATKLAEKIPISALIGLPVMASTTRKVPITDGTTTLARRIIVRMIAATLIRYIQ